MDFTRLKDRKYVKSLSRDDKLVYSLVISLALSGIALASELEKQYGIKKTTNSVIRAMCCLFPRMSENILGYKDADGSTISMLDRSGHDAREILRKTANIITTLFEFDMSLLKNTYKMISEAQKRYEAGTGSVADNPVYKVATILNDGEEDFFGTVEMSSFVGQAYMVFDKELKSIIDEPDRNKERLIVDFFGRY